VASSVGPVVERLDLLEPQLGHRSREHGVRVVVIEDARVRVVAADPDELDLDVRDVAVTGRDSERASGAARHAWLVWAEQGVSPVAADLKAVGFDELGGLVDEVGDPLGCQIPGGRGVGGYGCHWL